MNRSAFNNLVLARHGEFDAGKASLNDIGRKQAILLGQKLARQFGTNIGIFSSTGPRSAETASIAALVVDGPTVQLEAFSLIQRTATTYARQYTQAIQWLDNYPLCQEAVCIVTAGEFARDFFTQVGQRMLETTIEAQDLERGEARIIDMSNGAVEVFYSGQI